MPDTGATFELVISWLIWDVGTIPPGAICPETFAFNAPLYAGGCRIIPVVAAPAEYVICCVPPDVATPAEYAICCVPCEYIGNWAPGKLGWVAAWCVGGTLDIPRGADCWNCSRLAAICLSAGGSE